MINAENVWNIIINNGLCHPDGEDLFMDFYRSRKRDKIFSYRLNCPLLGRGCKLWQDGKVIWIDIYGEDVTEAKRIIIDKVNREFESLANGE